MFFAFLCESLRDPLRLKKMATTTKNDIWLKAAVVGSLWGASEIVLGSFLHNLKYPSAAICLQPSPSC
jgi:hypothetical protein